MKHKLFFLAFILLMFCGTKQTKAQSSFYHRSGDTIQMMDTIYWAPQWFRDFLKDTVIYFVSNHGNMSAAAGDFLKQCFTDRPLQVIGIASVLHPSQYGPFDNWPSTIQTREQEYLRLYQAYPDTMILLIDLPVKMSDPYRYMNITLRDLWTCCEPGDCDVSNYNYRIYEKYLDKPVTVTDSFYIGGTSNSFEDENHNVYHNGYIYRMFGWVRDIRCTDCIVPNQLYKMIRRYDIPNPSGGAPYPPGHIHWWNYNAYLYTFPILLIDTTFADPGTEPYVCPQVQNFRKAMSWESGATLMWDVNARHIKWQLRIAQQGQPAENAFVDTCINVPFFTVDGLQGQTHYSAYIRAVCEHYGDTLYGDWSAPLDLYTITSINSPDEPNTLVHLMPNPASEQVQVLSSFALQSIEIYNLRGQKVYADKNAKGISATIDISKLETGTYIVVIHNQQGVSTRKLIVQ